MYNVIIADGHSIFRYGLKSLLAVQPDFGEVEEAETGPKVLDLVQRKPWNAAILDIKIPGRQGIEFMRQLHERQPHLPVLVLTAHPEEHYAMQMLKVGAKGYISKESPTKDIINAIRKICSGETSVPSSYVEHMPFDQAAAFSAQPHRHLSTREYEVMTLIASGKKVSEIAAAMSLSVKTVSTYRVRLLHKMHLKSNAELTHYSFLHHLVG